MKYIPFHQPYLPTSVNRAVSKVIQSGWLTTGPKVHEFALEFGRIVGTKNSIPVSSCTAALHLACLAHDVKLGDEVIVPSYTFCSAINVIIHCGAKPVFCDIDPDTLCADPTDIEQLITAKTKGIMVVHFAGMPADMNRINALARKHKLFVIEDAAHAFLTKYMGKMIGQGDNTTCFSFYATKNLTTAEGGMLTTKDNKIANYVRLMSMHGISKEAWKRYAKDGDWRYDVSFPGYKYNLTDLQAVIGLEQLKNLSYMTQKRDQIVAWYSKYLGGNPHIILPKAVPYNNSKHAWHLYVIQVKSSSAVNRNKLIAELKKRGIGTSVHFIPNHMQSYYRLKLEPSRRLPVTEAVYTKVLSLPLFVGLTKADVMYIAKAINQITGWTS